MLRKHAQLLQVLLVAVDIAMTAAAAVGAYYLRFTYQILPVTKGVPAETPYLQALPVVIAVCLVSYIAHGLYSPRRVGRLVDEVVDIVRANALALLILLAGTFFYRSFSYSQAVVGCFAVLNPVGLTLSRLAVRSVLRKLRRRGYNLRFAVVVGAGRIGQRLARGLRENAWTGIQVAGFVDDRADRAGRSYGRRPVLGRIDDLPRILEERQIDSVFIALPDDQQARLPDVLEILSRGTADVRIVPSLPGFLALHREVGEFDGLPIVSLAEGPLYGWNLLAKRALDVALSLLAIAVASPVLAGIAIAVKLSSRGPVFYRQERMGLDGRVFQMLKFRSMRADAELGGARMTTKDDPRRTVVGAFLRRTSLDELPQFFNVLRGDMSIVGPRPERPVFIESFKKTIPYYMLRHKIKAGITGWAQVNGWRGETSLRKRLQYDLYYIEHWSIWFDLRIMLMTVWSGLVHPNAY